MARATGEPTRARSRCPDPHDRAAARPRTADSFGTKCTGVNSGWNPVRLGVGGIVGPIFVAV
jgi:hypothetical protein